MKIVQVAPEFGVSPQLRASDFKEIASLGYGCVINNRPDGEEFGQMSDAEARAAAEDAGLAYHFAPFRGSPTTDAVKVLESVMGEHQKVLAFCRTGTRSITAWAAQQARSGANVDQVILTARRAGYDLAGLREILLDYSNS